MTHNIYSKDGNIRCSADKVECNGQYMGASSISVNVKSPEHIDFQIGDYITFRGEVYTLKNIPTEKKISEQNTAGNAFQYDNIKLESCNDELSNADFNDFVGVSADISFTAQPNFSFVAATANDLAQRIQVNLDRYYTGDKKWTVQMADGYVTDSDNVNKLITVSNIKCWDALALFKSLYDINFIIRGRTVTVGTDGSIKDITFKVGSYKGLYDMTRNIQADQAIITRLTSYGNTTNINPRYYSLISAIVKASTKSFIWGDANGVKRLGIATDLESNCLYDNITAKVLNNQYTLPFVKGESIGTDNASGDAKICNLSLSTTTTNSIKQEFTEVMDNGSISVLPNGTYNIMLSKLKLSTNINVGGIANVSVKVKVWVGDMNSVNKVDIQTVTSAFGMGTPLPITFTDTSFVVGNEISNPRFYITISPIYSSLTPNVNVDYAFNTLDADNLSVVKTDRYFMYHIHTFTSGESSLYTEIANILSTANGNGTIANYAPTTILRGVDKESITDLSHITWDPNSKLPNNMNIANLMLPGFPKKTLAQWVEENKANYSWLQDYVNQGYTFSNEQFYPYVNSKNIAELGIRPSTEYFTSDDATHKDIYPSLKYFSDNRNQVVGVTNIDDTPITDNGLFQNGQTVPKIKITIYNLGFNFDDVKISGTNPKIHFENGYCGGKDFTVLSYTADNLVLTCDRVKDDALGKYFPNVNSPISSGDKFVLSNIHMPETYIEQAGIELLKWNLKLLAKNDFTVFSYQLSPDANFIKRHDDNIVDKSTTFYKTVKEGDLLMIEDEDMGISSSVTIDNIKITEDDNLLPKYDIVLRDTKQVGTIEKVQQQIDALSGNGASAGYNNSQIGDIAYASLKDKFLSKEYDDKTVGSLNVGNNLTVNGQAILNDVVAKGIANFQKDIKVEGQAIMNDILANTGTFSGMLKAAAVTITGALLASTVSATTMNANTFIGDLTGNAASATKLQTPRSIFGQTYDGTSDVTGTSYHTMTGRAIYFGDTNQHIIGSNASGNSYFSSNGAFFITTGGHTSRLHINAIGNVGIGTIPQSYKLDVNGNARISNLLSAANGGIFYGQDTFPTNVGSYVLNYVSPTYGPRVTAYDGVNYQKLNIGKLISGTTFQLELNTDGTSKFNGGVIASGMESSKGGLFYGQYGTMPTGLGTYVANYTSDAYGARVLAFDGVAYKDLKLGAMPTSGVFGLSLLANGDTRVGYNIGTSNFVSRTTGWNVSAQGSADFRNIYADELRVQAFTADISQALAGSDYLTKSVSKLSANFVVPAVNSTVRIIVDDIEGMPATQCFSNGDYIRFRAFNRTSGLTIANVWGTVTLDTTFGTKGFSNGTQAYTFTCTQTTGAGLTIFKGSEVLDYGTSGSGLIARTTLDAQGSPYEQIATWVNDPSVANNYTVHARLGNLGGIANCNGYGIYTDNGFFTGKIVIGDLTKAANYLSFDTVNGLQIKLGGTSVATTTDVNNSLTTANTNAQGYAATAQTNAINTSSSDATTKANAAYSNAVSYTNSQIIATNNSITAAVNAIEIGGRNLFGYSKGITGAYTEDRANNGFWFDITSSVISLRLSNLGFNGVGGTFTVSGYIKASTSTTNCYMNLCDYDPVNGSVPITTSYTYFSRTFTNVQNYIAPGNYNGFLDFENLTAGVRIYLKDFKIERGNKATTITPAPEDIDSNINNAQSSAVSTAASNAAALYVTQSAYSSQVTILQDSINAKVSQTDYNALGQRVGTAESTITQHSTDIASKVAQTDYTGNTIASLINQTATTIQIQASRINLVGAVTFSTFSSDLQTSFNDKASVSSVTTAQTTATNAATAASNAQTSANTANSAIANIVSDNMLSANEKGGERDRWNVIASEKSGIDAQATTYGITTEKTAYDTAFQTLATYLNNGTAWTSGIPNWITDANLSVDTTVVGTTYRSKWQGYFDAKTALLNAIYAKAKVLADNAQGSANTAIGNAATAQTTASNAATAASNAQTSANTANSAISDMTSDDKITAQEKQAMKTEWDSIASEKTKNDTQADNFAVSRTTYDSAYSTLSTTIGTNLSSLTTTWDLGSGGGATLRSQFKAYYDARTDLLNSISTKAKTLADAAKTTADNAQGDATSALTRNNTMAVKLGYTDYNALASAAALGHTLIDGGMINTVLINATAVVTNGLTANCITANMISAGAITADKIAANTITGEKIDANSVSASIANVISLDAGRITTGKLSADRIDVVNVVADGIAAQTINAQNATFENLNVTSASIYNGTIYNLRSPWEVMPGSFSQSTTDNIIVRGSDTGYTIYHLSWDNTNIGRFIRLADTNGLEGSTNSGSSAFFAETGKYFYINGNRLDHLYLNHQIAELIGIGVNGVFMGWVVLNIKDLMPTSQYGSTLDILAQGIVTGTSTSASISYRMFNGGYVGSTHYTMSVSRLSEGLYRISFPTQWGLGANYMVMATGYGTVIGSEEHPSKATIKAIADGYFDVWVSDDSTVNDGSFAFQMFNMNDI